MNKAVLLILFNHKFERNLPRLRQLYSGRFDSIFFIMPFYTGDDADVIAVYDNSFYFQGYIAQALNKLNEQYDHYIVIGDDLLLNPAINQDNYKDIFKLTADTAFIPEVFLLHDKLMPRTLMRKEKRWYWNETAVDFKIQQKGIEVEKELPSAEEAGSKLLAHGYHFEPVLSQEDLRVGYPDKIARKSMSLKTYLLHRFNGARKNYKLKNEAQRTLHYPMVGSYSDIVIIPKKSVKKFAQYAGVTAALNLFVEIAIPTIILLTNEDVRQEKDLPLKGNTLWESDELALMEKKYQNSMGELLNHFPENTLYIHPIKLSKWK